MPLKMQGFAGGKEEEEEDPFLQLNARERTTNKRFIINCRDLFI